VSIGVTDRVVTGMAVADVVRWRLDSSAGTELCDHQQVVGGADQVGGETGPFVSGGEGSVRGYGLRRIGPLSLSNDPLGGLSLIEGSAELRRPLFWKLNGALFFDCGQVATQPYDLRVDALQCGYGPAAGMKSTSISDFLLRSRAATAVGSFISVSGNTSER
jgi:outer membrane protein assembly factor BamA